MPEQPPVSFSQARERAIEALSAHFARDDLSLDELERRIERAYQAVNVSQLDALTADLGTGAPSSAPVPAPQSPTGASALTLDHERVVGIMSETKRRGRWIVPQELDVYALMSDTTIDLTQATLPSGIADIRLHAMMAAVKIVVPPGVHVVERLHVFMGSESNDAHEAPAPPPGAPVIRLSGWAVMAEVKVRVRRREELGD